ncbi:hypothetical protein PR048_026362 [Dryococelus australis]|uniref:Uncharacterized protein n=1 Tax=Dryococelus australis TaxID=614101 RepID=A0ABQ9GL32_9NEOP|nr:hypothetical protein PR048_026362 [Dryococelus australis]
MEHSHHSPESGPCDSRLFNSLKSRIGGSSFREDAKIGDPIRDWLERQDTDYCRETHLYRPFTYFPCSSLHSAAHWLQQCARMLQSPGCDQATNTRLLPGGHGERVVSLLASHRGEPGSIPGRATPGFSQVRIVPDDAVGQRVFSGISRFRVPSFRRRSIPSSFTFIGSEDHNVKSSPNIIQNRRYLSRRRQTLVGAAVAERLARSPPTKANRVQSPVGSPDLRKWGSCRTMPSVGGFSQGSPASPGPSLRRRSMLTSTTLIGSQDLAVKSRLNLFTRLHREICRKDSIISKKELLNTHVKKYSAKGINDMKAFIDRLPRYQSHYCRSTVAKITALSADKFRIIFTQEYNISFKNPKMDTSKQCGHFFFLWDEATAKKCPDEVASSLKMYLEENSLHDNYKNWILVASWLHLLKSGRFEHIDTLSPGWTQHATQRHIICSVVFRTPLQYQNVEGQQEVFHKTKYSIPIPIKVDKMKDIAYSLKWKRAVYLDWYDSLRPAGNSKVQQDDKRKKRLVGDVLSPLSPESPGGGGYRERRSLEDGEVEVQLGPASGRDVDNVQQTDPLC